MAQNVSQIHLNMTPNEGHHLFFRATLKQFAELLCTAIIKQSERDQVSSVSVLWLDA